MKLRHLPLSEAITEPKDGQWDIWAKRWWIHQPGKGLIFYGKMPACNPRESIARQIQERHYPDAEVIFVERICLPHNCNDYYV